MVHEQISTAEAAVYDYDDKVKCEKNALPEKHFVLRESVLTALFQNPHLKTVHHMFVAIFLGFVLSTILRDFLESDEGIPEYELVLSGFGRLPLALAGWGIHYLLTCGTYFCFCFWAKIRSNSINPKGNSMRSLDKIAVIILMFYYFLSFYSAVYIVRKFQLSAASSAVILLEQTRLLMKVHAFLRGNCPKVLKYKMKSDQRLIIPSFRHFLFFTMAPTLVYRDEYPRTKTIRWRVAATYALEIFAVILFYSFAMVRFLVPTYKEFGLRKFTYTELFLKVMDTSFPGVLYLLTTFYLILHLVQNFFAEILRFGDRMFYKDWWTATDFTTWYRTWNVVVHDWLYTYVYKDCFEIIWPGNRNFAKYMTFFVSAAVHEWVLMHMFGFFFPLMFILFFVFSTFLTYLKIPKNCLLNILFWMSLSFGSGLMLSGYTLEFYARYNKVPVFSEAYDFYIPRCITCDCYL